MISRGISATPGKMIRNMDAQKEYNQGIADKIKAELKRRGWDYRQFSKAMNRADSQISKWLSGRHNFTINIISEIETVLGISIITL